MRDIYSERVILFGLMMENTTWCVQHGVVKPSAWIKQADVVQKRYDIPRGIIEQQAFRVHPEVYKALAA